MATGSNDRSGAQNVAQNVVPGGAQRGRIQRLRTALRRPKALGLKSLVASNLQSSHDV